VIVFLIALLVAPIVLVVVVRVLEDRASTSYWQAELARVRLAAAEAERRLHDLTRAAFVAMAEEAEHRRESH
jgi:hypothetical protein